MKYDIFISYRRDGGDTLAQLIYDRLTARGYRVFLDVESLRSGKFNEKLLAVMDECRDVVVILPPGALERCSNEEDWLYLELHHALKTHKNIIPVMMKGFEWPEKLPAGLEELCNFNGIQDSKDYFDAVIDKMTTLLRSRKILFGKLRNERKKRRDRPMRRNCRREEKTAACGCGCRICGGRGCSHPQVHGGAGTAGCGAAGGYHVSAGRGNERFRLLRCTGSAEAEAGYPRGRERLHL